MLKLNPKAIEALVETLHLDVITKDNTRPMGENDTKEPSVVIKNAITREAIKRLKEISVSDEGSDKLEIRARQQIDDWNHYIDFAFDPKHADIEFYHQHQRAIDDIAGRYQKGQLKGQMDRQLIWRFKQMQPADAETLSPLAEVYQDLAIKHNSGFIMGTIGNTLASPNIHTDLNAADFTADAIETIKEKMHKYDPTRVMVSSYMTMPIKWGIMRYLKGNAQDRFERRMRVGTQMKTGDNGDTYSVEAEDREEKNAADSFSYLDPDTSELVMTRFKQAAAMISSDRAREVLECKMENPDYTLEEIGKLCGCTRENVRQGLREAGKQISFIDPALTQILQGIMQHDEELIDTELLELPIGYSLLQEELREVIPHIREELDALKEELGKDNIVKYRGSIKVNSAAHRGDPERRQLSIKCVATHDVLGILEDLVESKFKGADFNILDTRHLQDIAFYPGGSPTMRGFIDNHIEEIAEAGRTKILDDQKKNPKRLANARKALDRFYDSNNKGLQAFKKMDIRSAIFSPEASDGTVPDHEDLMTIRRMGMANALNTQFELG